MRDPSIRATFDLLPGEIVVDNFAGGGGASTGIEAAIGRPCDIAINHDPVAVAMHRANHPDTRHYVEDVWAVDPREAAAGRPIGLAWFSPDCFPAGTLILTREGYRPIESIVVGDEVLTHTRRWRRVTATMSTVRKLVRLRGHGHPGITVSGEHPFLARRRCDAWSSAKKRTERLLGAAEWTPASSIGRGWYWATPAGFPDAAPPPIPAFRGRTMEITPELMWLAGRYIADGWTRLTDERADLVITCGLHEVAGLREKLRAWPRSGARAGADELAWNERETGTAYQFTTASRGFVLWLRTHFGHGAAEKLIPGWALGMARSLREALLAGYMSGDGHRNVRTGSPVFETTTVSKALAFGVRSLATSLGKSAGVYFAKNRNVIEGRKVNALPVWRVMWREELDEAHRQTFRDEEFEWAAIREREDLGETGEVFNLSVDEDESYIAEGLVVHNCTQHSRAKGGKPVDKNIRALAWVVIRWAKEVAPRVILLENVPEFADWGPLDENDRPIKDRRGETFREWLAALRGCGYLVEYRALVAADYGAPTTRKRLFLVARRDGRPIVWPEASHGRGRPAAWRTAAEVIDWSIPGASIFGRKRPLAAATMNRIAAGLRKYVFENAAPFIIPLTHQGDARAHSIGEPLRTITAAHRGEFALVSPFVVRHGHYSTITGAGLVEGCGAGTFRGQPLGVPLATICATNDKHLVCPIVTKHYGGPNGNQVIGHEVTRPLGTVTAKDHHALSTAHVARVPAAQHGEVRAFLTKYYGAGGAPQTQDLFGPLHTVTSRARFGLVVVHGEPYEIVDITTRMLQPHELFAAQGFPESYVIDPIYYGKPLTKSEQIHLAGNSVCPPNARALVAANIRSAA